MQGSANLRNSGPPRSANPVIVCVHSQLRGTDRDHLCPSKSWINMLSRIFYYSQFSTTVGYTGMERLRHSSEYRADCEKLPAVFWKFSSHTNQH